MVPELLSVLRAQWFLRSATHHPWSVRLAGRAVVRNQGTVSFGDRVHLVANVGRQEYVCGPGAELTIGPGTFINHGTMIRASLHVAIGAECRIGTYCLIADSADHGLGWNGVDFDGSPLPVTIEDRVWLAARVVVMPGVTIGYGSVVGAGSVVTEDVPPMTLVAGVPAKLVRSI